MRPLLLALALASVLAPCAAAQDVGLGAGLSTRYVWRGTPLGDAVSVQPSLWLAGDAWELGAWGLATVTAGDADEIDLYATYAVGPLELGLTDYYFPTEPPDLGVRSASDVFNVRGDGTGAHSVEAHVTAHAGPAALTAATFVYNDPTVSTYLEAAVGGDVGGVHLGGAVGAVVALASDGEAPGSLFYGTSRRATVTNLLLSVRRDVPVTSAFSFPAEVQLVVNPETERAYLTLSVQL